MTDAITPVATLSKRVCVYVFTTKVKKSRAEMLDFQITKHPKNWPLGHAASSNKHPRRTYESERLFLGYKPPKAKQGKWFSFSNITHIYISCGIIKATRMTCIPVLLWSKHPRIQYQMDDAVGEVQLSYHAQFYSRKWYHHPKKGKANLSDLIYSWCKQNFLGEIKDFSKTFQGLKSFFKDFFFPISN